MMHAFLFTGATSESRRQKITEQIISWNISPFDEIGLSPNEEHITIDDIRMFKRRLILSPMKSDYSVGVIYQAKSMTTEAQNALLKLLEEPGPHVRILIETDTSDMLLPTIVSRCEIVRVTGSQRMNADIHLVALLDSTIGEKLTMLEAYTKNRIQAKTFIEQALLISEKMLVSGEDTSRIVPLIRRLLKAQSQLSVNCNPKLVLDRAFIF